VFNIGNFTSENNPCRSAATAAGPRIDTWTAAVIWSAARAPGDWIPAAVITAAGVAADWVTDMPRRMCDRLFAMNDTEAYWRGWQITKVHCGLGRRYRDPAFDSLALCAECRGTGFDVITMITACNGCLGAGRLTITLPDGHGGVS
jgi:hypothetical protein